EPWADAGRVPGMRRWLIPPDEVERLVRERNPALWQAWETRTGRRIEAGPRPLTEREGRRAAKHAHPQGHSPAPIRPLIAASRLSRSRWALLRIHSAAVSP